MFCGQLLDGRERLRATARDGKAVYGYPVAFAHNTRLVSTLSRFAGRIKEAVSRSYCDGDFGYSSSVFGDTVFVFFITLNAEFYRFFDILFGFLERLPLRNATGDSRTFGDDISVVALDEKNLVIHIKHSAYHLRNNCSRNYKFCQLPYNLREAL